MTPSETLVATTDPNRNTTTTSWDANRRLTNAISPPGVGGALTTSYAYDANGSLLQAQQSSNGQFLRAFAASYTPTGKIATTTDARGAVFSTHMTALTA